MQPGYPNWAEIDLDALAHNVRELKRIIGAADLLAVVKANAYGHGAARVAETALKHGAKWLGVARVEEGIQLRRIGIGERILLIGCAEPSEAENIVKYRLTPTVNTRQLAIALSTASAAYNTVTPVHIKVDTGLTRYGLPADQVVEFAKRLVTLPNLRLEGLYTHFATADEHDKSFVYEQLERFHATLKQLENEGIKVAVRHAANSAAALDVPESRLDMVRCGITLYGLYPSESVSREARLRPVLSLKSRVARVCEVPTGTTVSYGRTYRTEKAARLALVPVGYADGLSRALSNKGTVLIHGVRVPIVGRICMDQCVVNVDAIPDVRVGDIAVIIGQQGNEAITADDLAKQLGTISYEITCSIGARVPRVYLRRGRVLATDSLVEAAAL